jgi:hypothetical protein
LLELGLLQRSGLDPPAFTCVLFPLWLKATYCDDALFCFILGAMQEIRQDLSPLVVSFHTYMSAPKPSKIDSGKAVKHRHDQSMMTLLSARAVTGKAAIILKEKASASAVRQLRCEHEMASRRS